MKKVAARDSILLVTLLSVSLVGGCKKKKQQPQVAQAPTIALPQTTPTVQTPPSNDNSAASPANQNASQQPQQPNKTQNAQTQPKPKPKHGTKPSAAHKTPTPEAPADKSATGNVNTTVAKNIPPKITIEANAQETGGAISATGPHSDDVHDKLSTDELLRTTDDNLKSIKRQLTLDEQAQVVQIRNFMAQSRAATTDSDLVRARNLALKAHLLSDELIRHK
jgi:outer membrane biosynthesis protein TonB